MIAATLFQFILLAIHNHRRYLLIHEYQNRTQNGGQHGDRIRPSGINKRRNQPTAFGQCGLELGWHLQLWCGDATAIVEHGH